MKMTKISTSSSLPPSLPPSLTSSHGRCLKENTVVDVANEAVWAGRTRPLPPQQVKDACSQLHMLTVFNKLTQVGETWEEKSEIVWAGFRGVQVSAK